ncbi:MAG: LytTR family transcriptional regulator DNA-binding domain-containing protein [Lachnospiraceae bacterium]
MKEIEEKLQPFHFFRCNKGYLVALKHVDSVQDGCAIVHGEPLLISRARKNEFMDALTDYVGGVVL